MSCITKTHDLPLHEALRKNPLQVPSPSDQSIKFAYKINPSFGALCPLKTSPCQFDNVVSFDGANCAQKSGRNFFEEFYRLITSGQS